jgi:hypothetical protein
LLINSTVRIELSKYIGLVFETGLRDDKATAGLLRKTFKMNNSPLQLNLEFILLVAIIAVIYLLPRFKYTSAQNILRTPSYFRQGILALIATVTVIVYHAYLISNLPESFLNCKTAECHISMIEGLMFLVGYNHPEYAFTEYGNHSRIIFCGITLLMLSITINFYLKQLAETHRLKVQLLHLKRKCEVLLERHENPAYESKEEFTDLYVDYDLPKLGLKKLDSAIREYQKNSSLNNFNSVVESVNHVTQLSLGSS